MPSHPLKLGAAAGLLLCALAAQAEDPGVTLETPELNVTQAPSIPSDASASAYDGNAVATTLTDTITGQSLRTEQLSGIVYTWQDTQHAVTESLTDTLGVFAKLGGGNYSTGYDLIVFNGTLGLPATSAFASGVQTVQFQSMVLGSYEATTNVFGLPIAPVTPQYFLQVGNGGYQALNLTTTLSPESAQFSVATQFGLDVAPGGSTSFSLAVAGGPHLSYSWFELTGSVETTVSRSTITSTLLSQAPVPEPQSYALFAAGLLALGAVYRRRQAH